VRRTAAVCLLGPTASGKSALALPLAEALDAEIVSVDSAQIYRGMDIGTAKPSPAERSRVTHHLIDIREPTERYSAANFAADARRLAAEIRARGRSVLLVGGTMLYFKALREGLDGLPSADPALRREIAQAAAREGWPALHARLAERDPASAARIGPNDAQRIQRALEVCTLTGQAMSALLGRRSAEPFDALWIALVPENRILLHARIAARFDAMLQAGLVDELRALRARFRLDPDLPAMRCVGYRQAWQHLDGTLDARGLRDKGIAATRQLAKRQLTWLRRLAADITLDPFADAALDRVEHLRNLIAEAVNDAP
jgi:tRNA dimethylallyltransferase